MKSFVDHLSTYAKYHRDPRNILTHLVGVPMIVFAVILLLSRPSIELFGYIFSPALAGYVIALVFYLRLNLTFGVIMAVLLGAGVYFAALIASQSLVLWLVSGLGLFIVGWIIQFVGHHYEGKKPAFIDDLVGLLIGPLFVTAEVCFALGMFKHLKQQIEHKAGVIKVRSDNPASI
jgi:uncharacterized membrane protein YGL010W